MIKLINVTKNFGHTPILINLSLTVPDGESYALLGLSGSGKTTVLKLICGLHIPDSGEVYLQNLKVSKDSLTQVRAQIGYVIQDGGLFPHMTVFQNLSIVGKEAGWDLIKIQNRIDELINLTKLSSSLLNHYPSQLSGGQKQRVGIIRALMLDPPVLLLDEPLGALDPITRSELQVEIRDLCRRLHKTVLLVTHDLFEAGYLADKILLLNHGQIVQAGTLKELINFPADEFVQKFVDSHRQKMEV